MAEQTIDNLDFEDGEDLEVTGQEGYLQDDDDVQSEFGNDSEYIEPEPPHNDNNSNDDRSVLNALLKHYGIDDSSKISFEEDGVVAEKNWDDLSFEEKMNILKTSNGSPERDLDDNEVNLINDIRKRNLTPEQFINQIKQDSIANYQESLQPSQYKIDDLTDEEIYILDLQDKVEDITDEEITQALAAAKQNESFFKKQVKGIRAELKQQEDAYNQQIEYNQKQAQTEQFNQFKNTVNDSVGKFNQIGDLDLNLDDTDRSDIMSFILDVDDTGMSTLGKALNDPNMLVKLGWFALYGEQAFKDIKDYFTNQISLANQSGYQKGLAEGKKSTSRVYTAANNGGYRNPKSVDDLWG